MTHPEYILLPDRPPFTADDPMTTYNLILKGIDALDYPRYMTKSATLLIKKLCRESPNERLGYYNRGSTSSNDIRNNRWFDGFAFEALKSRMIEPPIKPIVNNNIIKTFYTIFRLMVQLIIVILISFLKKIED